MPGNQGGSNWGTTAADPQKGIVFVVGVNQVAILKLDDVTKRTGKPVAAWRREQLRSRPGSRRTSSTAPSCHGADLRGALAGRREPGRHHRSHGRRRDQGGRERRQGQMRPVSSITEHGVDGDDRYLANSPDRWRGGSRRPRRHAGGHVPAGTRRRPRRCASAAACRRVRSVRSIPASAETPATCRIPTTSRTCRRPAT